MFLLQFKTFLRVLLLPPAGPLLLAIMGLLLLQRRARLARALLALGLGSLWLLATPVIAEAITRLAEHYPPLDLSQLGGEQGDPGRPGQAGGAGPEHRAERVRARVTEHRAFG